MKIKSWKERRAERMPVEEVRKARLWVALPIGIAVGVAMTLAANLLLGVAFGVITFVFLLMRRGRV